VGEACDAVAGLEGLGYFGADLDDGAHAAEVMLSVEMSLRRKETSIGLTSRSRRCSLCLARLGRGR
jgi:hypothetical protein